MKICMQNMKRMDCNAAMWLLDDVGVLILFIMMIYNISYLFGYY